MAANWQRRSLTWGKRLTLVILIVCGMFYGVLSLAERSKDSLRMGLEDYLRGVSGQSAEITEMVESKLMPDMVFTVKGVNIRDVKNADKVYIHADSAHIAMPFWRILFGLHSYAGLEVRGLEIASGFFLPKKLTIDYAGISDPPPQTARPTFVIEGKYNDLPLLITMVLERRAGKKHAHYSLPSLSLSTFKLGPLEGDGIYSRRFSGLSLEQLHLTRKGQDVKMTVEGLDNKPLDVRAIGTIDKVPFNATIKVQADDTNLLTIIPETDDTESLLKIEQFVRGIEQDFALTGKDKPLTITIAKPSKEIEQK